jgi:hypothetical protein
MLDIGTCLRHYKRKEIQEAMVLAAKGREVAVRYGERGYGKRPDTLSYPKDVLEFAKNYATSFHVSEEHWNNIFSLSPELRPEDLAELRSGWDLVIDIDCKYWEYSKLTAKMIIDALHYHGIRSISIKFSGNKGFHIGVPFQAFPKRVHDKDTKHLFPEGARRIAGYLTNFIEKPLIERILKEKTLDQMSSETGKPMSELVKNGKLDILKIIDIDTLLISSRHLYRMPYSLHEKSGLCSVPFNPDEVMDFSKDWAKPEKVLPGKWVFLDTSNVSEDEAQSLLIQAFDYTIPAEEVKKKDYNRDFEALTSAIPEDFFPPCIKLILAGTDDGRKRSMFILMNFLSSVGYNYDKIDEMLHEWNKKNREQLREVLIKGHLRYKKQHNEKVLPPNCDNQAYYKNFGVCKPDNFCPRIKNPANYAILKAKMAQPKERAKHTLTEEQKEMRRKYRERMKAEKK